MSDIVVDPGDVDIVNDDNSWDGYRIDITIHRSNKKKCIKLCNYATRRNSK